MGDRRVLLGTSAVLVGLGSALVSGTAVASADTADTAPKSPDASAGAATDRGAPSSATRARRAVEKAVHLLQEPDDHL